MNNKADQTIQLNKQDMIVGSKDTHIESTDTGIYTIHYIWILQLNFIDYKPINIFLK